MAAVFLRHFCGIAAIAACLLVSSRSSAGEGLLVDPPVGTGGNPVGRWRADSAPIGFWVSPELAAALGDLYVVGTARGETVFEDDGTFSVDVILDATLSAALLGAPIQLAVSESTRVAGAYSIEGALLLLSRHSVIDTLAFTAGDSLALIRSVPLGEFAAVVSGIDPSGGPLARLSLSRVEQEGASADFDGNGVVDFGDFVAFVRVFGAVSGDARFEPRFDLDGDGIVGFLDFLSLARQFGR